MGILLFTLRSISPVQRFNHVLQTCNSSRCLRHEFFWARPASTVFFFSCLFFRHDVSCGDQNWPPRKRVTPSFLASVTGKRGHLGKAIGHVAINFKMILPLIGSRICRRVCMSMCLCVYVYLSMYMSRCLSCGLGLLHVP